MLTVGVGYENLPERLVRDYAHYVGHAQRIELVENIVEQKQRSDAAQIFQEVELGKTQGDSVGLALPLRTDFAHQLVTEHQFNVVAVHTLRSKAQQPVFLEIVTEQPFHRFLIELAAVIEPYSLVVVAYNIVIPHKNRSELHNPLFPAIVYLLCGFRQISVDRLEKQWVGTPLLQHGVTLLQRLIVAYQRVKIAAVALRDNAVDQPPPLLSSTHNHIPVLRRDKHQRKQPDMSAHPLVFLSVAFHRLLLSFLNGTGYILRLACALILALQQHELFAIAHRVGIRRRKRAFTVAQIIYRVKNVSLSHTVVAEQAVHLIGELQRGFRYIPIIQYGKGFQYHIANIVQGE